MPEGLPFHRQDYLSLVDWTGRCLRDDKRGSIPREISPILERLNIDPTYWKFLTQKFESHFKGVVATVFSLRRSLNAFDRKRVFPPLLV